MAAKHDDRRIRRTKKALREAIIELMAEQDYDSISIQQLVDRADVGRSTFYTHYADKEDLLQESIADLGMFVRERIKEIEEPQVHPALAFSLPMLEHADEVRVMFAALLTSKGGRAVERTLHDMLLDLVGELLDPRVGKYSVPRPLLVEFVVSVFLVATRWWLLDEPDRSVDEVQGFFLELVAPSLEDTT